MTLTKHDDLRQPACAISSGSHSRRGRTVVVLRERSLHDRLPTLAQKLASTGGRPGARCSFDRFTTDAECGSAAEKQVGTRGVGIVLDRVMVTGEAGWKCWERSLSLWTPPDVLKALLAAGNNAGGVCVSVRSL